ncbi:MAG TPA: HD-GYP domain-containing protein [Thermomicrobiaceae bacterium]|nr:HD-GYP domain-containing protein [Thermomicrobiaceae bacterium]
MQVPTRARALVMMLVVLAIGLVAVAGPVLWRAPLDGGTVLLATILVGLIVFADFFDIELPLASVHVTVSVSSALCFAAALTLGPLLASIVAATGAIIVECVQRRPPVKLAANVSNYVLATFVASWFYTNMARMDATPIGSGTNIVAMLGSSSLYMLISSWGMAAVLSQVVGMSPWQMWRASAYGVLFETITLPTLGSLIPVLKTQSPFALVIAIVPLLGPYLAFRSYRKLDQETRHTIELLADLLDRRDPSTSEHSKRVTGLVRQILPLIDGISTEDVQIIVSAARIHDLGKIGTSDLTLQKPGKLTGEERTLIQRHAADGAEILSNLSLYRQAAVVVRHHHERWDGLGYPDGLAGQAIPIGSRVISVADTYDAMTSDRVYRRGLPHQVAMAEIRRSSGTQFDPAVVDAFERIMDYAPEPAVAPILRAAAPD